MIRRIGDIGLNGNGGLVLGMNGGRAAVDGLTTLLEVLLDETLLVVLADDGLPICDERSHEEDEESGEVGELESE